MPLVAQPHLQLVAAARRHEPDAWNHLLQHYQLPLFTYARELLRDREAALDAVQETFRAAVRNIGGLRDDAKFASWLFGIVHQKCLQHLRRKKRDGELFGEPAVDAVETNAECVDDAPDPGALLLGEEQAARFFALVEELPAVQRSALLLHVLENFSLEEIAAIAGAPVGTIKSRLFHAKRALRRLVEEAGLA